MACEMENKKYAHIRFRRIPLQPFAFLLLHSLVLFFSGCDQTFQPLQKNDQYYFSIYGYLDAAADTQWVRVAPARQSINELPNPVGISVTIEDIDSGEIIKMKDSLFTPDNFLNYWSAIDIENEKSYRIIAERVDGKSSSVTVTTPEEIPLPIVNADANNSYLDIYIDDSVENIADLQVKWYIIVDPRGIRQRRTYTFSLRDKIDHTEVYNGSYHVYVDTDPQLKQIAKNNGGNMNVLHRQFFVAAGGPDWDQSITSINDLEYFLDETTSNVEDGLGYVIGIDSKWMPLKACLNPERTTFIPCEEEKPYW